MARARRPVRCRNCGYVATPVSGFCPNCLDHLPLRRAVGLGPLVALGALLVLALAVPAALSTGPVVSRPSAATATPGEAAVPSTSPTTSVAGSSSPVTPAPSPSAVRSVSPPPPLAVSSSPSATAQPPSPSPAVLGNESTPSVSGSLPSTSTVLEVIDRVTSNGPVRRPY